jgi:7-carboxy-7-deazaguanine synthase
MHMRVSEIYRSIQGEGSLTGMPSVFVRASGCNLRCAYCDTPYTSWEPEGEDMSVGEIARQIELLACGQVVITGGEPMLFAELIPLCARLRQAAQQITIETAGTLYLPVECDLMSISPKRANSTPTAARANRWRERHERTRHAPDVIRRLLAEYAYQIKFVIDTRDDCADVEEYLAEFPDLDRDRVWLMPQGTDAQLLQVTGRWLEPYCRANGLRFCPRRHIEWFGFVRGT